MSITAYKVEAVGHDRTGEDYGYVNIKMCIRDRGVHQLFACAVRYPRLHVRMENYARLAMQEMCIRDRP